MPRKRKISTILVPRTKEITVTAIDAGSGDLYPLKMQTTTTVRDLYSEIIRILSLPTSHQLVVFIHGYTLKNEESYTIEEYGICNKSAILFLAYGRGENPQGCQHNIDYLKFLDDFDSGKREFDVPIGCDYQAIIPDLNSENQESSHLVGRIIWPVGTQGQTELAGRGRSINCTCDYCIGVGIIEKRHAFEKELKESYFLLTYNETALPVAKDEKICIYDRKKRGTTSQ